MPSYHRQAKDRSSRRPYVRYHSPAMLRINAGVAVKVERLGIIANDQVLLVAYGAVKHTFKYQDWVRSVAFGRG